MHAPNRPIRTMKKQSRLQLFFRRCYARRAVAIAVVVAQWGSAVRVHAEAGPPRCAVLNQADDPTAIAVADLFTVRLAAEGYPTVDRNNLNRTLGEQALAQAFSANEPTARRDVGRIAGADLLVFVNCRTKDNKKLIEWSVASMPTGLRVAVGGALWDEHNPDAVLDLLVNSVRRAATLRETQDLQVICVPAFACRDPGFEFSDYQKSLAKLAGELLMQMPGVVVVALDEVDALTTETGLTGDAVLHTAPLFVAGSFTTRRIEQAVSITIDLELRSADRSLGRRDLTDLEEVQIAPQMRQALSELLAQLVDTEPATSSAAEIDALHSYAVGLLRLGEWDDALPLLKTAALLRPDDLDLRADVYETCVARMRAYARQHRHDRARHVDLMINALDAFQDLIHRRPVTDDDIRTYSPRDGHAHLYGSADDVRKTDPDVVDRFFAYRRRARALLGDIVHGRYGPIDNRTRDLALDTIVRESVSDRREDPDAVYTVLLAWVRELSQSPGEEDHVVNFLMAADWYGKEPPDVVTRFRTSCRQASNARLAALASFVSDCLANRAEPDLDRFSTRLDALTADLHLQPSVVERIRTVGQKQFDKRMAQATTTKRAPEPIAGPKLAPIAGAPNEDARQWFVGPDEHEYLVTDRAFYRVNDQGAFEKLLADPRARVAYDSRYLWVNSYERLVVLEPTGRIVAELISQGSRGVTPLATGKALVAEQHTSDEGGRRYSYEILTVRDEPSPGFDRELLAVEDDNQTIGVVKHKYQFLPYTSQGARLDGDEGTGPFFFNGHFRVLFDETTREFTHAKGSWPNGTFSCRYNDSFILIGAFGAGNARSRAILTAAGPNEDAELWLDLGWLRHRGDAPIQYVSFVSSTLILGDWLHVTEDKIAGPPAWFAVNLKTKEARTIMHSGPPGHHGSFKLVVSPRLGLLLLGDPMSQVQLPPEDQWQPYEESIADLRFPDDQLPKDPMGNSDPWRNWRPGYEVERYDRPLRRPQRPTSQPAD